jgi:gas vesicle protein
MDIAGRANELFSLARSGTGTDIRRIFADHSAKGLLGSGATLKLAVAAYGQRTSAALKQVLDEVSNRINHRGRAWRKAMETIAGALEDHLKTGMETIEPALKMAGAPEGSSARRAVAEMLATVSGDLRSELKAFQDGWTAPIPKSWQERHPVIYALALLVIGAIVGKVPLERLIN